MVDTHADLFDSVDPKRGSRCDGLEWCGSSPSDTLNGTDPVGPLPSPAVAAESGVPAAATYWLADLGFIESSSGEPHVNIVIHQILN